MAALSWLACEKPHALAGEPEYAKAISSRLNQTGRVVTMPVPLKDGKTELGEVTIRLGTDDSVLVSKADVSERLQRTLDMKERGRLAGLADEGGFVSLPALKQAGITLRFDHGLQELHLDLSADQRQTSDISLGQRRAERPSSSLAQPALVSGYLNIIAGVDHLWGTTPGSAGGTFGDGHTSGRLELDSAIRLRDTVLENRALYEGEVDAAVCPTGAHCMYDHAAGFKRQSSRLVYDDPERRLRLQIGDTEAIGLPIQRSVETLGVSLEKSARKLAPGESVGSSARTSLRIDRPSEVDVIVNGAILQRLHLRPGIYNIRDLPLATGANEIKLAITDDAGVRRTETFTTFAGSNQLQAGQSEWAFSAGVPSWLRDNERIYETDGAYMASGMLRYGIHDGLTGEVHAQADNHTVMGGGGILAQTPWGFFGLHGAASTSTAGNGGAADLSWDLVNFSGLLAERNESLHLSAEYRSPEFRRPGEFLGTATGILYPEFNYWLRVSGSYSVALDWAVTATLSARYQFADHTRAALSPYTVMGDRYGADLTLARPLSEISSASLLVGYSNESFLSDLQDVRGPEKPAFRVALRLNVRPDDRTTVSASYDTLDRQAAVSAYRSEGNGLGRWDTSLDVQQFGHSDTANASGSVGYYGNRAEVRLSHNADAQDVSSFDLEGLRQRSSLRVGSSLAFADGVVAVGPPIRGGAFAIVHPHESIAGKEITVGDATSPRAKADVWGPAVVTDVPAYAPSSFGIDVADLPVGYSLGAGAFDLNAPYRAGYALEVGSASSITVYGTLVDDRGEPMALASGRASPADGRGKAVAVFTNSAGKFAAEGLAPGRWILEMPGETAAARYSFDVPKGINGLFKAGTLKPMDAQRP